MEGGEATRQFRRYLQVLKIQNFYQKIDNI